MVGQTDSATTTRPPEDSLGRAVWYLDRALRLPEDMMNLLAALASLFLVLMGVVSIVMQNRFLFDSPIAGIIDLTELAMPILAILGISYCQRMGTHIRMDILMQYLSGRVLWIVETFAAACIVFIAIMLTIFSFEFFLNAYQIGDTTQDIYLDTWPSKLLVPIALAFLVARGAVQTLGALRLALDPSSEPVGVVVQKDIAQQAQDEIREAMGDDAADQGAAR